MNRIPLVPIGIKLTVNIANKSLFTGMKRYEVVKIVRQHCLEKIV
jgi:hypothetical protein